MTPGSHPYRSHVGVVDKASEVDVSEDGTRSAAVFVSLCSAARVGIAIGNRERLGFEPVMALALCVLVPAALVRGWWAGRRARHPSPS